MNPDTPPKASHAMVLAAGFGTRMRPLTLTTPKPLVDVAGKALLDWALDGFARAGVERAVVNVHHLAPQIKAHVAARERPRITCIEEDPILETGGGVEHALSQLGDAPFFVANSDGLWRDAPGEPSALERLNAAWSDGTMDGLLLLFDPARAFGYRGQGDFTLNAQGRLARRKDGEAGLVFTGVQLLHPRLFENAPGGAYSLNVLYDRALAAGRLFGLVHTGEWHHVGTLDALEISDRHIREHPMAAEPVS